MNYRLPEWQAATEALHRAKTILIVTHVSPDGDAIGSALGMGNAFRRMGKDVTIVDDDGVPNFLGFLPHSDTIRSTVDAGEFDLFISTDSSDEARTGVAGAYGRAHSQTVINLDHHITNTGFGDIHLVVPQTSSAAEVAFEWLTFAGLAMDPLAATPLLTGMVTDTLGFRTSSVTPHTMTVARHLMEAGASLNEIMARTLQTVEYREFLLWQRVLPKVQRDGAIFSAVITDEDIQAAGLTEMTEAGMVGWLRTIDNAMIAVIFKQDGPDCYKISMRAKEGYNVASVALALGGGGHEQAAGATVTGSLDEVRARVLPLLREAVAKGKWVFG